MSRANVTLWLGSLLCIAATVAHAGELSELVEISEAQDFIEKGGWPGHNSPGIFSTEYEYSFERLMTRPEGRISDDRMPWSDTWWPNNRGGIANRWQVTESYPNIRLGNFQQERERVRRMTREQIKLLSPAEKYDISQGDYNFTLTRNVLGQTNPHSPDWFGICNGWTAAALAHREPAPVTVTNSDGIVVDFGSSDVKGILAHFYTWQARGHTRQLGHRCQPPRFLGMGGGDCQDVHPASFHIVLVNQIGFMNRAFGVDVDGTRDDDPEYERTGRAKTRREYQWEVWNQPVFAYRTRVLATRDCAEGCRDTARGTVRMVRVETLMTYADDDHPVWQASIGTNDFFQESRRYEYWLEIDFRGNIVGGSWITEDRPDYLWTADARPFTGMYQGLNQIYRRAPTRAYCLPAHYSEAASRGEVIYPLNPLCEAPATPVTSAVGGAQ